MTTVAESKYPKTTYYTAFPEHPRPGCSLAHVFWVVANDYRQLQRSERRNVVYPAKRAGLIDDAPPNERGVKENREGETSRCGFVLTDLGVEYWQKRVKPVLPEDFVSNAPLPKTRIRATAISTADLKKPKEA